MSLNRGVARGFVDAALTVSSALFHPDEAFLTPAGAPGVTDNPVRSLSTGLIADESNRVVGRGAATSRQDSALVGLEALARGVDGDGHWSALESAHHGGGVTRDLGIAACLDFSFAGAVLAGSILSCVGVSGVKHGPVGHVVVEGSS